MSFLTQRIANRFPHWSKVRRDPSSLGQRTISTFAETLEVMQANQYRLSWEMHPSKFWLGLGAIYTIDLEEEDYFPTARSVSGGIKYTYPDVFGDSLELEQVETYEDMIYGVPTRIELAETLDFTDYLIWDSEAAETYNAMPDAQRLWVLITDSDEWIKKTESRNPLFEGSAFIRITGIDINDLERVEVINPKDDGLWRCSYLFKEVTAVETEGWTGRTRVYWANANQETLTDPYKVIVLEDFEAPLQYELSTTVVDATTHTLLTYKGQRFKDGTRYRRPNVEDMDSEEQLTSLILYDGAGQPFNYADYCISDFNGLLCVLDDAGVVHVYDANLPDFAPSQLTTEVSSDPYMRIEPLNPFAIYGATEKLFTSLFRPRYPVVSATIKRVSPSGVVRYLQADLTWGVSSALLGGGSSLSSFGWQELTFETEYDEVGQWEYWVTCRTAKDSTVNYTAVMVGALTAAVSLDTELAGLTSVSFDRKDQLQVSDGASIYRYTLHKDCWLPREETNQIITRETYAEVEVSY